MKLAYVCSWWRPAETTWSGSPACLMKVFSERSDIELTRVDAQHGLAEAAAQAAWGRARGYGTWKYTPASRRRTDARVLRRLRRLDVDAVLALADVETVGERPTFFFQDASFSMIRANRDLIAEYAPAIAKFPPGRLDELIDEQRRNYLRAAGVMTYGQYFADWLVEHDGVSPDRSHSVGIGLDNLPLERDPAMRGLGGTKVLFIGREFVRKGGDLVVHAVDQLRSSGTGDFTLTVIGPSSWPMTTPIPDWVDFRAEVASAEVRNLWAEHDIFAMPSWYEPYGKVFLEARAAGLPSLGRHAFSMPEAIPDTAGRLIPADGGVDDVAQELLAISQNADLYATTARGSSAVRGYFCWPAVTDRMVDTIRTTIRDQAPPPRVHGEQV